jgi:hypothetical protein
MAVRRFVTFVAIGSAFATVEEFLTVVVLRHDVPSYLFTLLVLFPSYLTLVYLFGRSLDRLAPHHPGRDLIHLLASGGLGLLLEWTLMGLSPWSNPAANPLLMLGFQLGMFAFWATVATAPRAFLDQSGPGREARRRILRFYVPYFALIYAVSLSVPQRWRFGTMIPSIVVGYSVVAGILFRWAVVFYHRDIRITPGNTRLEGLGEP